MASVVEILSGLYNPDARAMAGVVIGSAFILLLFISNPDPSNPVYLSGILVTLLVLTAALVILVSSRER